MPQKIPAKIRLRNKKHAENVTKRGNVTLSSGKENTGSTVGPVLLGLFLFVVVGNAFVAILQSMTQQSPFNDGTTAAPPAE
mmetsp:Transcript_168011/g.408362  ORF Transcript_168011/g.408362 Transcript_168011/m.408362 type:complete len:81 (-) Transcript_168011:180-422(-)